MSYVYNVYSFRPVHYFMELLLESPANEMISFVFFAIGALGAVANILVLYIFFYNYSYWRLTTRLWVNLSLNLLCGSLFLMFRSVGDQLERLSTSEMSCRMRYLVPLSLDVCAFGCLMVMFGDRVTVVHFPNLYIYNEKNNNTKLMYGWFFGLWVFVLKGFILDTSDIPMRCTTPVSLAFPLEMVTLFTYVVTIVILLVTLQSYASTPNVNTSLQTTWVKQELAETIGVLMLGASITALWAPKYILTLVYITSGYQEFEYQVLMTLLHIPARLSAVVPLMILLRKENFWDCFTNLSTTGPDKDTLITKIATEEVQADVVLHSVLQSMYPNHPEFAKEANSKLNLARQVTNVASTSATLNSLSSAGGTIRPVSNATVTFVKGLPEPTPAAKKDVSWENETNDGF